MDRAAAPEGASGLLNAPHDALPPAERGPTAKDARGDLILRRYDFADRIEALEATDRKLRLLFIPAGLVGGIITGVTHAFLGEPLITLGMVGNTVFFFLGIQGARSANRREREELQDELDALHERGPERPLQSHAGGDVVDTPPSVGEGGGDTSS